MSIEYTIDIQLTELGFPDILEPQETSVTETPCLSTSSDDSLSPSHSHTSLPNTGKERLLVRSQKSAADKEAAAAKNTSFDEKKTKVCASPLTEELPCKPPDPPQSQQNKETVKDSAPPEPSEPTETDAGRDKADSPLLITQQGDDGEDGDREEAQEKSAEAQQDVESDSDDSDVSVLDEDEEVDDEEEEEEGPNNESSNSGEYRCSVCDLQLSSEFKLQDHMNLHTGVRPYCCAECGKRFCQIYNYRVHLRTHAQTSAGRLQCRICLRVFASQEDLKGHLSKTHFEDRFYECDLCKRVFASLKACEYHVQLHNCLLGVNCKVCGHNFTSLKALLRHQKRTCCRNFKCTDCAKTFTKKNALLKHSFTHLGLLPYTCIRCRSHFRLAKLYRQHKCEPERIHCVACLREFLSQADFQQHKKDTGCWGNQEPKGDEIRCLECGQRFDTTEELKKHAGAHQRVLKCAECGKGFRSALLLMSHMGGHAGKSPCLCQSCGLGFPHQQNYDSHLKKCGQTPQSVSAPKKRPAPKSSSPETKKLDTKSESPVPASTTTVPAPPVKDSASPDLVTGGMSNTGSASSDGLWKITLDKQPPPGVKLVLFLPVCQTNGLALPSTVPQTIQVPDVQVKHQAARPPLSRKEHLGVKAELNVPVDLVTRIKRDPEGEAPLDLSKKYNSCKSATSDVPLPPVKSEPKEFEVSGEAKGTKRHGLKNAEWKVTDKKLKGEADAYTNVKWVKSDISPLNDNTASSGLIAGIKKEPQSPGSDFDVWRSRSCQLRDRRLEKEIKMEVDVSHPSPADTEN
ncbi:zinc finger protein 710 [Scomber japonicus]|uniref:zinc finger protein 710 n=1 Tax=Scomber japonicus TaxID=13676 RepID=UPI002305D151|nr:zinc finger protein 710 [Scomber japonicus]